MDQTWKDYAAVMAADVVPAVSRWRDTLESVPRHVFVPYWWERDGSGWLSVYGAADMDRWLAAVYQDTSLITRIGPLHADRGPGTRTGPGRPTSSSTHPSLLIQMYRHAVLAEGLDVLDVGTGSGYGTALLAARLGEQHVTSVDVDTYLVKAARDRLAEVGINPRVEQCDATAELPPGGFDRIIATVGVSPIPPAWIKALRPGGRIVTVLDGTEAILTADMQDDGTLRGRIERDWAGFMSARHGEDYPADGTRDRVRELLKKKPEHSQVGLYPLADLGNAWELHSTLAVQDPDIRHHWQVDDDGLATLLLWDGESWARAEGIRGKAPTVRLGGPVDLWRKLEGLKTRWLVEGRLPLYGATATVSADGTIRLERGQWTATIQHPPTGADHAS